MAGRLGRSGGVVAAVATGEKALDDALDAGHALRKGLDVLAKDSNVAADFLAKGMKLSADFLAKGLKVSPDFLPEALPVSLELLPKALPVSLEFLSKALAVGPRFRSEALAVGPDFLAQCLRVGPRIAPKRQQQSDQGGADANECGADDQDTDEFGGHGRLPRCWGMYVFDRPGGFNGSTGSEGRPVDRSAGPSRDSDNARRPSGIGQAASSWRLGMRPWMTHSRRDVRSVSDCTSLRRSPRSPRT